jgi:hypothetical protein
MKGHVDNSMGIVTRIAESLTRIKPTEPLRLVKRETRKKQKWSDSSGNSPAKILASRCACKKSIRVKSDKSPRRRDPKCLRRQAGRRCHQAYPRISDDNAKVFFWKFRHLKKKKTSKEHIFQRSEVTKWIMIYVIKIVWSRVHDQFTNRSRGMAIFRLLITRLVIRSWSDHDLDHEDRSSWLQSADIFEKVRESRIQDESWVLCCVLVGNDLSMTRWLKLGPVSIPNSWGHETGWFRISE